MVVWSVTSNSPKLGAPLSVNATASPAQGATVSMSAGIEVSNVLPLKQLPSGPAGGSQTIRNRSCTLPLTTLSLTVLRSASQRFSSMNTARAMPAKLLSVTRLRMIRLSLPPAITIPPPKPMSQSALLRGVSSLPLSWT